MGSPAPPILLQLPQELQNDIYSLLEADDIKKLRVTCSAFHKALPLHFDHVFISANSLNIDVFNAIASHETFRHQVSEIIWDDARLRMGPELEQERQEYEEDGNDPEDAAAENVYPFWFKKGRYDYGDSSPYVYPDVYLGIEESWAYYKGLLDDQRQVLSSNADIEAFKYGLKRFTSLKRVTVTPATHGKLWQPLYRTPMVRAFPPDGNDPYQEIYGAECTAEAYRAKWRGFRLVTRALVECEDRTITELVIGGNGIQSGLNCRIFDQRSTEYDDFVALLKRPGFRYLGLHLFTGLLEDNDWVSYKTGLLHDALAQATDLEHFSLRTSMEVSHGAPQQLVPDVEGHVFPMRTIFPIDHWPHLRYFRISHMLVDLDDFIDLLATLPPSLRSIELIHVALGSPEQGYDDLLRAMRDILDWSSRPAQERPKVHMMVSALHDHVQGEGKFVEVDDVVHSYLYENGDNPFEDDKYVIWPGQGGVQRDIFNPDYVAPY
ncbi:hypothetical protein BKA60DRAFT_656597 [Fusarium oxysporum]|nr:hypothetical protein BKA60DRAFT_656597 [Fusarium oxysporum]